MSEIDDDDTVTPADDSGTSGITPPPPMEPLPPMGPLPPPPTPAIPATPAEPMLPPDPIPVPGVNVEITAVPPGPTLQDPLVPLPVMVPPVLDCAPTAPTPPAEPALAPAPNQYPPEVTPYFPPPSSGTGGEVMPPGGYPVPPAQPIPTPTPIEPQPQPEPPPVAVPVVTVAYQVKTYAIWNSADKSSGITLSNGDATIYNAAGGWQAVRANIGKSTGKWYWEIRVDSSGNAMLGVGSLNVGLLSPLGSTVEGWGYFGSNGSLYHGAAMSPYGAPFYTVGDIIGVKLDLDAGTLEFTYNNVPQGLITGITGTMYPMAAISVVTGQYTANFGASTLVHPQAGFNAGFYN